MTNKYKIHLVDDEPILLELLAINLTDQLENIEVSTSLNGIEALRYLEENSVDVLITDLKMPKMNGFGLTKEVIRRGLNIPIILHSSYAETLGQLDGIEAGLFGIVEKPTNYELLGNKILKALQSREEVPSNFLKLHVSNLMSRKYLPFNLYIKVNGHNFVHLFNKGEGVPRQKIVQYFGKGVESYYVKREEFLNIEECIYIPVQLNALRVGDVINFPIYTLGPTLCYQKVLDSGEVYTNDHCERLKTRCDSQILIQEKDELPFYTYLSKNILNFVICEELTKLEKVDLTHSCGLKLIESILGNFKVEDFGKLNIFRDVLIQFVKASQTDLLINQETRYSDFIFKGTLNGMLLALKNYEECIHHENDDSVDLRIYKELASENYRDLIFLGALLINLGRVHVSFREHQDNPQAYLTKGYEIINSLHFFSSETKTFLLSLFIEREELPLVDLNALDVARRIVLVNTSFQVVGNGAAQGSISDHHGYSLRLEQLNYAMLGRGI